MDQSQILAPSKRPARGDRVVNMDLHAWKATVDKLTLRETGELVRALVRAQNVPRPNREQRMLLAIFTRPQPDDEVAP